MIDFRYHVVSLVAVLLALATGILLGSSLLSAPLYDTLERTTQRVTDERDELRSQVRDLEQESAFVAAFVEDAIPLLVADRLAEEEVLVLTLPGAQQESIDKIIQVLDTAGATITGQIGITDAYADPNQESVLDDLAARLVPPGIELPEDASTYDRVAIEIAVATATQERPQGGTSSPPADAQVLPGLAAGGFITVSADAINKATHVVVVAGPPPEKQSEEAGRDRGAYLALVRELDDRSKGVVVAGPRSAATGDGFVAAFRGSEVADGASSVDNADSPYGRVAIVYALLAESLGTSGQYGVEGTTDGPLPELARSDDT